MPIKTHKYGVLSKRGDRNVLMLDEPELGHLQAIVLKKLEQLGTKAYGYKVIESLSLETGVWIDPSQVYSSIRKISEKGYLAAPELRPPAGGGPPMKIYTLSAAGRAVLKATADHHQALADYLNDKRKAGRS